MAARGRGPPSVEAWPCAGPQRCWPCPTGWLRRSTADGWHRPHGRRRHGRRHRRLFTHRPGPTSSRRWSTPARCPRSKAPGSSSTPSSTWQRLPEARLVMFGQGTEEPELRASQPGSPPAGSTSADSCPGRWPRWPSPLPCGFGLAAPGHRLRLRLPDEDVRHHGDGHPCRLRRSGARRAMVSENGLGWAVPWDRAAVAAALRAALGQPPSTHERDRLTEWTRAAAGQSTVAARAAHAVLAAAAARGTSAGRDA